MQHADDSFHSDGSESDASDQSSDAESVVQEDIYYRVHDSMNMADFLKGSVVSPLSTVKDALRCKDTKSLKSAFIKHDRPVYNLVFLVVVTVIIRLVLIRGR